MIGQSIAQYTITERIGEGSMGEVYRATDTKLDRQVALKILPKEFTNSPQRLSRFRREARLLAALNHPHIGAIYGVEESAPLHVLVLELIEGETLGELIRRGPIPIDDGLKIAFQIAEALEAAHEKGIIHRDLKPDNVKITTAGQVKILDFGLAKGPERDGDAGLGSTDSPAVTADATATGIILGTAAYMSPEQAKGEHADRRADIWSFGAVLFEMLAGRRPFVASSISETLAAVLKENPDWSQLPRLSYKIRDLIEHCLRRDPHLRIQSIGDVRLVIEEYLADPSESVAVEYAGAPRKRNILPWSVAAIAALVAAMSAPWHWMRPPSSTIRSERMSIRVEGAHVRRPPTFALSPNGEHLAYVNVDRQILVRQLGNPEWRVLDSSESAGRLFFAPANERLVFWSNSDRALKMVHIGGGGAVKLLEAGGRNENVPSDDSRVSKTSIVEPFGLDWITDEDIVLGTKTGLYRVSLVNHQIDQITQTDREAGEDSHRWPQILPDGQWILFTAGGGYDYNSAKIQVVSLADGQVRTVLEGGTYGRYLPTGHLLYAHSETLRAASFDLDSLRVAQSVPVIENMAVHDGAALYSVSQDGKLVYISTTSTTGSQVVWVDREGNETLVAESRGRPLEQPRVSPDGKRLIICEVGGRKGRGDVVVYDFSSRTWANVTYDGTDHTVIWHPDGDRIVFESSRDGPSNMYLSPVDGRSEPRLLVASDQAQYPGSFSPQADVLAFTQVGPTSGRDLWLMHMGEPVSVESFLITSSNEHSPMFSPDGSWIAYVSDQSGREEVYLRPSVAEGGQRQVSTEGGRDPVWSSDGKTLFYRVGAAMMEVAMSTEPRLAVGRPQLTFEHWYYYHPTGFASHDISPDGKRFLMVNESLDHLAVITNWFEELKRLVPTDH